MTRKIAILGGGASALFAAWDLVHAAPDAYDITVYQVGWRIGGKGASGRRMPDETSATPDHRIEEHGLHLMFGFYDNVFRVVREAYAEHYNDPQLWRRFFKSEDSAVAMIDVRRAPEMEIWPLPYPEDGSGALPGDPGGTNDVSLGLILRNIWSWIRSAADDAARKQHLDPDVLFGKPLPHIPGPSSELDLARKRIDRITTGLPSPTPGAFHPVYPYWDCGRAFLTALEHTPDGKQQMLDVDRHKKLLDHSFEVLERLYASPLLRSRWAGLEGTLRFVIAVSRGLFTDLFVRGSSDWFELDDYDFRKWIDRHGGDPSSPIVCGLYDAVFATYSDLGAGAILQSAMKAAFLFKGSAIFKMQAGMGDTIFTPLYHALKKRNVKFEFFHRVESLRASADGKYVETIEIERQVALGPNGYDPLVTLDVDVGGPMKLDCWPSEPVWSRLPVAERDRIEGKLDLESHWTPKAPERIRTLTRGQEFDDVILGISVAALPDVCHDLLIRDSKFAKHVSVLAQATTATQAIQLWTVAGKTPEQPNPIVVPYTEPYDTIADMKHLLPAEGWKSAVAPGGVHYLCSAIQEKLPPPGRGVTDYPAHLRDRATAFAKTWVMRDAPRLWKNIVTNGAFDWSALYDPADRTGPARFDAQWVCTPTNLSDRYVIPTPMSIRYRLKSNETQFENLYLTGDWIKTSLSVGCLEAAAMSGIQAARAVSLERGPKGKEVGRARGDWIEDVKPRAVTALLEEGLAPSLEHVHGAGDAARVTVLSYRLRDGELTAPPPYQLKVNDLFLFLIKADGDCLRKVCDNELNLGDATYTPLGDFVVLYAAGIDTFSLGTTCSADEIGIWIPVVREQDGHRSLFMYSPYVWLDSATSTTGGRAVYGYTKHTAAVNVPASGEPLSLSVTADVLAGVAGDAGLRVQRMPVLTAAPSGGSTVWTAPQPHGLTRWLELAKLIAGIGVGLVKQQGFDDVDVLTSAIRGIKNVFLKQTPSAGDGPPVYQAIVEAGISTLVDTVAGCQLPGSWKVTIPSYFAPRIVDTLGLAGTTIFDDDTRTFIATPVAQAWMQFEGTLEAGTEQWRAPTT